MPDLWQEAYAMVESIADLKAGPFFKNAEYLVLSFNDDDDRMVYRDEKPKSGWRWFSNGGAPENDVAAFVGTVGALCGEESDSFADQEALMMFTDHMEDMSPQLDTLEDVTLDNAYRTGDGKGVYVSIWTEKWLDAQEEIDPS